MAKYIEFVVPGEPIGKARPRVVDGHAYTPSKTKSYEERIRLAYKQAIKAKAEADFAFGKGAPLMLSIDCYYSIPQSASKARKARMMSWEERPLKKPDLDNVIKAVADALNGYAYHDDSQIVMMQATKKYGATPCLHVLLFELQG